MAILPQEDSEMRKLLIALTGVLFIIGTVTANAQKRVVVPLNEDGFFLVDGSVTGEPVQFTIDTGAMDTVLGGKLAAEVLANLPREVAELTAKSVVDTVTGEVAITRIRVKSIKIGDLEVKDFPVSLAPGMPVNLIGTDFLKEFDFSFKRKTGELILEQE